MSSDTDHYLQKYLKTANEFWALQQLDKTEEEVEYDNLIKELEKMLVEYREEIERLENENEELQQQVGDATKAFTEYHLLRDEQTRLLQLQSDISRYRST